jgi:MFS family permease
VIYLLEGKKRIQVYMATGLVFCALAFLSLLLHENARWVSLLMILLITVGEIAAMPFMNTFWTLRSNEQNRGQYAALYTMAWGIAQVLGPYLCSHLAEAAGFEVMFGVLAGILLIAAIGFYNLPSARD